MTYTKDNLLEIGAEKLKKFGFIHVTKNNVLEDEVYKYHFKKFISFLLGQDEDLDMAIRELFSSIDKKEK